MAALARKHGLTHAALNALAVIEGAGGPLPAGEVSARMHITTATMTSVLDTLERNGHVVRQPNPKDRRSVLVDITPSAQAVLDRLLPEVQLAARSVFGALDDDALRSLLDHLAVARAAIESFSPTRPFPPSVSHPRGSVAVDQPSRGCPDLCAADASLTSESSSRTTVSDRALLRRP